MRNADQPPRKDREQIEQVAQRLAGHTAVTQTGQLDLLASVGGIRGILEATVPALVFLIGFIVTSHVWTAALLAVVVALIASLMRIVQKQSVMQALAGAVGVVICAAVALMQGSAGGYFVPGFYISAAYGLAFLISMTVKWPIMGLIFGWIRGEGVSWQRDAIRRRKYQLATFFLVCVFTVRLAVQLPLYLAGEDVMLGVMRLLMGVPLYGLALWFGWLVSRPTEPRQMTPHDNSIGDDAPGETQVEPNI